MQASDTSTALEASLAGGSAAQIATLSALEVPHPASVLHLSMLVTASYAVNGSCSAQLETQSWNRKLLQTWRKLTGFGP